MRAGRADAGGVTYDVPAGAGTGCYPAGGHSSYVVLDGTVPVTLVGQPSLLTNDRLAKEGNASLMLGTLGSTGEVVWFVPPGSRRRDRAAVAALGAAGLGALGRPPAPRRGRRLHALAGAAAGPAGAGAAARRRARGGDHGGPGPDVPSRPGPRPGGRPAARGRARPAAAADRAPPLGTGRRRGRRAGAANRHPRGRAARLLAGPPPTDDAGLVRLARTLDQLDREVRRP